MNNYTKCLLNDCYKYPVKLEHTDDAVGAFSNAIQLLKFCNTSTFTKLSKQQEQPNQKPKKHFKVIGLIHGKHTGCPKVITWSPVSTLKPATTRLQIKHAIDCYDTKHAFKSC